MSNKKSSKNQTPATETPAIETPAIETHQPNTSWEVTCHVHGNVHTEINLSFGDETEARTALADILRLSECGEKKTTTKAQVFVDVHLCAPGCASFVLTAVVADILRDDEEANAVAQMCATYADRRRQRATRKAAAAQLDAERKAAAKPKAIQKALKAAYREIAA